MAHVASRKFERQSAEEAVVAVYIISDRVAAFGTELMHPISIFNFLCSSKLSACPVFSLFEFRPHLTAFMRRLK